MFRTLLTNGLLLSLVLVPPAVRAATALELKSVTHELPDSDRMFPAGPGADLINNNCLACHSADMVLNQPALSKNSWTTEVSKMINIYRAPVAPQDVDAIVDYLTRIKSSK
jgi:mono/diheme cytochrome c family protein